MSQKIDGNLQVFQVLCSVMILVNKFGVSIDVVVCLVEVVDSLCLIGEVINLQVIECELIIVLVIDVQCVVVVCELLQNGIYKINLDVIVLCMFDLDQQLYG